MNSAQKVAFSSPSAAISAQQQTAISPPVIVCTQT